MRVLVVHREALPGDDQPVPGATLRVRVHVEALRAAGHDVHVLRRVQGWILANPDGEPPPAGAARSDDELTALATAAEPDWILCVSPADAPALAPVAPLVVDLYAPRLLEAAWEQGQRDAAGEVLRAVEAADEVLYSNVRQRWFGLGLLGAAGWDLARDPGLVVPLAAQPVARARARRGALPVFVAGGMPWPWQDLTATLAAAAEAVRGRAEVHTFGLPEVPGTVAHGRVPRTEWLAWLARSAAALDRYAPNTERALAFSFRQADYLGAGVPLVSDADTPLADGIRRHRAGWVDEPLADALEAALAEDRSAGARALAAEYAPEVTEAPLVAWQPRRRERPWSLLVDGARLARAEERERAADRVTALAEQELAKKHTELADVAQQSRALAASVEALSAAMLDVASFRRETVAVLGARLAGEHATTEQLHREVETLRADLAKKEAELAALARERDRLGRALDWVRGRG